MLDVLGALLAGLGLVGALSDPLAWLFADRATAWIALGVGIALMAYAVAGILKWALENARTR